ncbi:MULTISPECIES: DUF1120 domain-containing protein [unclassified Pseudomonas]|uniref:DUF1120 domain-containing protein n=1 Tax=unclassified Pseudomonas TaxID=196821 RepID=UPI000883370B|nr:MULTISPECIES: DUF1120 domain-containing protein [unclassified Pseudomonas]UVL57769.1 DUF1120 domain-containing protein [Pseudomonas sp. B21-035]SDQ90732.1 Protein of unknown function [Pseudomonas sp. UC 17F4]
MKTSVLTLAVFIGVVSANTFAATTDLTVTGTITPAACSPTLGNGGVIDYGAVSLTDLEGDSTNYRLPVKTLSLAIDCDAATTFALMTRDNRLDTLDPRDYTFGLGMHQDQSIGSYMMTWEFENTLVDGEQGFNFYSNDGGQSWDGMGDDRGNLLNASRVPLSRTGFNSRISHRLEPIRNVNVMMDVRGFIKKSLVVNGSIPIDGSATIEVVYL